MKQDADLVLAQDHAKRLRKQVLAGRRLMRTGLGMEHYATIVRFNAVADSLLAGYPSISEEDYKHGEDVNRRVVSMEGLLGSIKKFILGHKKEAVTTKVDIPFWQRLNWLDEEVEGLVAAYTDREGSVTIPERYAGFFPTQGKLAALLKADATEYRSAFTRAKPELDRQAAFMKDIDRQFDKFMGDADKPKEFAQCVAGINAKQTNGLAGKWKDNGYNYLGWGKMPYLDKNPSSAPGSNAGMFAADPGYAPSKGPVTLPYPNRADLTALVKELKVLCETYAAIEMYYDDYPTGFDFTDPPVRGYYDFPEVDDQLSNSIWAMEIFEDNNSNFLRQIVERIACLGEAMIVYLEQVLK
jgi:hypothetical protein